MKYIYSLALFSLIFSLKTQGQITVEANLNVRHIIDTIDYFDRSKLITIHADQVENEWGGNNFTADLPNDFLNQYDVYMGRNTGGISWYLNQVREDPNRPGFVDTLHLATLAQNARRNYANRTHLHPYEARNNLVIAGQLHPFWTGASQRATRQGWKLANATATGDYMGRYIKTFHSQEGAPQPAFVEIINEPAYESLGGANNYTNSLQEIADFHNEVAAAIRKQLPDIKIGGYTTAFPNFEKGNFQRWKNRWKLFMDEAGENMDFWSIHLYDFPAIGRKVKLRSGSNMEATFDMMEQYSHLSFNEVKPFVISEYGAQMHDYFKQQWKPIRDWLHVKASNAQLMSFMERPNHIGIAINFLIVKAEWGYSNGIPYHHRLMRKENEPDSYTGAWVYTDMVKFYQLWKNVKGTRIDTKADDLDIQVDAYVDDTTAYLILNNLHFEKSLINLKLFGLNGLSLEKVITRHLTLSGDAAVLEEQTLNALPESVELGAESTMILEYYFNEKVPIEEFSKEVKYYAETYLQPIQANQNISFEINGVSKGEYGEGILRLGVGRDHNRSLKPVVEMNGTSLEVPIDWRGDDQKDRDSFFGVLEIPVAYDALKENNIVNVRFQDAGGHISSVALQVFTFSSDIRNQVVVSSKEEVLHNSDLLKVFPNPADKQITLEVAPKYLEGRYQLLDVNGMSVRSDILVSNKQTIPVNSLPKGVYILKVKQKNSPTLVSKVILN